MESFFANQKLLLQRLLLQRKPEVTFAVNPGKNIFRKKEEKMQIGAYYIISQ